MSKSTKIKNYMWREPSLRRTVWYNPETDQLQVVFSLHKADISLWNKVGLVFIGEFDSPLVVYGWEFLKIADQYYKQERLVSIPK